MDNYQIFVEVTERIILPIFLVKQLKFKVMLDAKWE